MQMMNTRYKVQRGFSLITAIFLLVVLAALGAAMTMFFSAQQQSSALDVLGSRAYQASRAGIEWGAFQVLRNQPGAFTADCEAAPGVAVQQLIPQLAGTLGSFTVTVTCTFFPALENAIPVRRYQLNSVAAATDFVAGQANFVERQSTASIEN